MSTDRHATFQGGHFENRRPKSHFINERCFGEDAAKWLRDGLDRRFEPGDLIQEDYGWGFWTKVNGDPYWVSVQTLDESIGQQPGEWLLSASYDFGLNFFRPLFHRPKTEDLLTLCRALDEHLHRAADVVHNVQWWQAPRVGTPTPHPV
jgi:hypothetical protein